MEAAYRAIIAPVSGLAGVGIEEHPRGARIRKVLAGGAAESAGVVADDVWLSVNATSLAGMDREAMLDRLAGTAGTSFRIRYLRAGEEKEIVVTLR